MARFARPYCATEPVRTVPFFNLYDDDIQITQLGAYNDRFQRDMQAPLTAGFMPESSRTPRSDPGSPEEVGGVCPATISSAPLGTPQVTPNDTQRHSTTLQRPNLGLWGARAGTGRGLAAGAADRIAGRRALESNHHNRAHAVLIVALSGTTPEYATACQSASPSSESRKGL